MSTLISKQETTQVKNVCSKKGRECLFKEDDDKVYTRDHRNGNSDETNNSRSFRRETYLIKVEEGLGWKRHLNNIGLWRVGYDKQNKVNEVTKNKI